MDQGNPDPAPNRAIRDRIALGVGVAVLLAGVIDVVLRCYLVGFADGITLSLHDPGKTFFHIVLLPPAAWIFIRDFPSALLRRARPAARMFLIALAILCVVAATTTTANDHIDNMCERMSSPADIADPSARATLLDIQSQAHARLRAAATAADFENFGKAESIRYRRVLDEVRGSGCLYTEIASVKQKWSFVLSLIGALFVVSVFWSLLAHLILRARPSTAELNSYLVVFALMIPWLVLRVYSEWYFHFGLLEVGTYRTIYIALALAIANALILFLLKLKQRVQLIAAAILTGIPTVLSVLGAVNPEWFTFVARIWHTLDAQEIAIIYAILAAAMLSLIWYIMQPEDAAADGTRADA